MKIEDIQPGRTYPSRIGGEPFTVRQVRPEAGLYAGYVGYTRGNDNAMRSVTPADFIEMARLPEESPGRYECAGCGRQCENPDADLATIKAGGGISCCPDRKMKLVAFDLAAHPDDAAVDRFAAAMKAKLAGARAKGRSGWDGPECDAGTLSRMLREHVDKGDPRDVANFCCFLWNRGERIAP